ncbi:type I pantothenate kinase [Candidatus Erwinia haradaeae]|uniref:Pantothenate kinase n=1 Tax=Candidatus Erwinia haradaeae TaxID=1922217 RepID=A0A451D8J7_9GAMM|nr:type I pantothenate kinase [Candidatus Erwinia haradaeae]VFP82024.1 Pantothenate kinase [Candidatus Erwinia haradaeae]
MFTKSYLSFNYNQLEKFYHLILMILSDTTITQLKKINKAISIKEVMEVYLPLSDLINLYITSNEYSQGIIQTPFNIPQQKIPYIISITGSVSSGKSTIARILQILLNNYLKYRYVELISTDGFLYPNSVLRDRGLIKKKGFPLSYDIYHLIKFVSDIKFGFSPVKVPLYSHLISDITPIKKKIVQKPDILILEGLNVLQRGISDPSFDNMTSTSNFIDFSIYIDASHDLLQSWYLTRFLGFRKSALKNQQSYFYYYSQLSKKEALHIANTIWNQINYRNLIENILPTRENSTLIITKSLNHLIKSYQINK